MFKGLHNIPLFPLGSVLFPKGRVSLQIFEARYIDLVRRCLREQSGFGIVLIEKGSEVAQAGQLVNFHPVGTYCELVDWNELPSGLLGITVEGRQSFSVVESWRESNGLCMAAVNFNEQDALDAEVIEVGEEFQEYVELLRMLSGHPMIEALKLDISFGNLRELAWHLADLLPVANREKQILLELGDPVSRLEQIALYINSLKQQEE